MNTHRLCLWLLLCCIVLTTAPMALAQTPQGTAFTYQGELDQNGAPVSASADMVFALFDAASGGNPVGSPLSFTAANGNAVAVQNGIFTVALDFGALAFAGAVSDERYLSITVNGNALSPLTKIENAPYALQARTAELAYGVSNASIGSSQIISAQVQLRVSGNCTVGSSIRAIAQDGTVTCQTGGNGTVTSIGSGSGLTGGPITGSGTLAIANAGVGLAQIDSTQVQARVSGSCSSGQKVLAINADGSVVCAADATGGSGTVSSVASGTGLTGGPVTSTGTLSIANGGVGLAQINTSQVQARIGGTCALGEYIRGINADGTLMCAPVIGAQRITLLDNYSAEYSAIAIGINGLPVISYVDSTDHTLNIAHCINSVCNSATIAYLDQAALAVAYTNTSIAIGTDQLPVVSYYDDGSRDLKVAHCGDANCQTATITAVDTVGQGGTTTSIAIGTDGFPVVSYFDETAGHLKVVHCDNIACTIVGTINPVDLSANVGQSSAIAIGADGFPIIAYLDGANEHLKVAHCANTACLRPVTTTVVDSAAYAGQFNAIAIGADGLPVISYVVADGNNYLKVAHCSNAACSAATIATVDSSGQAADTSITIGADLLPIVSYYDQTNQDLKVAHCNDAACTSVATITTVDGVGSVGVNSGIVIGADGLPIVSYIDAINGYLKVVKCNNRLCE